MPRATLTSPLHHAVLALLAACAPQPPAPRDAAPTPVAGPDPGKPTPAEPRAADLVAVHGHVRAWGGAPIAGATVTAKDHDARATTDADGRFSLQLRPGGQLELRAEAPRHAPGQDEGPAPGHAFDLWLAPESTLSGRVTRGGAPVAGARVLAERAGGLTQVITEALTDATGRYHIAGLEPGSYSLRALTDDGAGQAAKPANLGLAQAHPDLEIPLTPALRITGQILGGELPCRSGALELTEDSRSLRLRFPTGPEGQVQALGLMPGEYQLVATCTGFLPGEPTRVRLLEAPLLAQRWPLSPGLTLRGRVLAADGGQATRLRVHASADPDPAQPKQQSYAEAELDANGRFALSGLIPGPYRVTLTASDARAVPQEPLQLTLAADTPEQTLTLPATGELRGTLRDAGGHGIDRALVMLAGSADAQHVLTADDGSFVFPAIAPRTYQLIARRNGQRLAGATPDGEPVTITAGTLTTATPIVATPDLRLGGLVRDAAGVPVAGAFVVLRSRSQQLLAAPVETDAAGRFTVPGLAPGKYRVRAYRRGGGEAVADQAEAGSELTLTLAP